MQSPKFPLFAGFKLLAIRSQIYLRDDNEQLLLYVKQKLLKLKEDISVYRDEDQSRLAFTIRADRMIDFQANYRITAADGSLVGTVKRKGMRSLWKANYEVISAEGSEYVVTEVNPWIKLVDGILGEIPIVGFLMGYFLHPQYELTDSQGVALLKFTKQPALWEGRFRIDKTEQSLPENFTPLAINAILLILLMERARG